MTNIRETKILIAWLDLFTALDEEMENLFQKSGDTPQKQKKTSININFIPFSAVDEFYAENADYPVWPD